MTLGNDPLLHASFKQISNSTDKIRKYILLTLFQNKLLNFTLLFRYCEISNILEPLKSNLWLFNIIYYLTEAHIPILETVWF